MPIHLSSWPLVDYKCHIYSQSRRIRTTNDSSLLNVLYVFSKCDSKQEQQWSSVTLQYLVRGGRTEKTATQSDSGKRSLVIFKKSGGRSQKENIQMRKIIQKTTLKDTLESHHYSRFLCSSWPPFVTLTRFSILKSWYFRTVELKIPSSHVWRRKLFFFHQRRKWSMARHSKIECRF